MKALRLLMESLYPPKFMYNIAERCVYFLMLAIFLRCMIEYECLLLEAKHTQDY